MWETQSVALQAGRGMIFFEHCPRKFEEYCANRQISPSVSDWRLGRSAINPATTYNIAWLANHFNNICHESEN